MLRLTIAGTRIDVVAEDVARERIARRFHGFLDGAGPGAWTFRLRPGPLAIGALTGRVARDGPVLRVVGAEAMGALDLPSRCAEATADASLVAVEGLLRAALTLDVLERGGCLFHAAAVLVDGAAHLVPGRSGAGKSTFAALASAPLADELCAVLPEGGRLVLHGTPWWRGRAASGPLAGIHALSWSGEGLFPGTRTDGLRHLLGNVTLAVDDPETRERAFAAAVRVASAAPFARLAFGPRSDVDGILRRARRAA